MATPSPTPDFTHLALKPSEHLAIVEYVHQTASLQETDYLEWKSGYDLSKRPGAAATARQLIGMANRDAAHAARHADGHAYVLIGVEPGNVPGVAAVWDSSDVENWLTPFAGAELRYEIHYVPYAGTHVLFLIVDAQREGDPIYALQKASADAGRSLDAGAIYVRHSANTGPTTPDDLRRLTARASARPRTALDLDVELDASKVAVIQAQLLTDEFRDERLADWRNDMLAVLPAPQAGTFIIPDPGTMTERRSGEEYKAEVEMYVQTVKSAKHWWWAIIAEKWLEAQRSILDVKVVNRSEENFENTVVELTLGLPRFSVYLHPHEVESVMKPAKEPSKWGRMLADLASSRNIISPRRDPEPEIERIGKETLVRYPELRVRPRTTHTLKPPLLLALAPIVAGTTIPVRWRVTASNTKSDQTGEVELKVRGEPVKQRELEERESAA
jgi:hypothetical protein